MKNRTQAPVNPATSGNQAQSENSNRDLVVRQLLALTTLENRVRISQAALLTLVERLRLETPELDRGSGSFFEIFQALGFSACDELGNAFKEMEAAILAAHGY
jgi:hypothetical protein